MIRSETGVGGDLMQYIPSYHSMYGSYGMPFVDGQVSSHPPNDPEGWDQYEKSLDQNMEKYALHSLLKSLYLEELYGSYLRSDVKYESCVHKASREYYPCSDTNQEHLS